ncbi:Zinc finger protein [Nesidiocoris tenuis]|uniref:Zinc finger protein n=1 Tax=Nesidiocoris tenuis TaxID=355587 RepID=A0ABN7BGI9_9HEMI|nr:Zinc finger protein [Nesidiocoris tenuis]
MLIFVESTNHFSVSLPLVLKPQEEPKTGPITCKGCNVAFNSTVGFGLHLKRSLKCVQANPDVDIPGVVDRNAKVLLTAQGQSVKIDGNGSEDNTKEDVVYMCEHCCSSFSSIWGLRTHERNSVGCKPDRPYEIPVPIPKSLADKLKKEFKEKKEKEREESKDKNEETPPAPSTTLVYSQLVPNADGKYKCSCEAVFNSIWGFRSHQRMSEKCKSQGPGENLIYRPSVSKKISLPPTAAKNSEAAPNVCPCCSARFSTPVGLRCHFRHSPDCGSTEAAPKRVDNTSDATVTSSGQVKASPGVYLCPCCPKDFKLPASLEQHFIDHAAETDSWVCCECDQIFADQFVLHRHFHKDHMGQWFCVMCLAEDLEAPNISTFKEFYTHIFGLHSNGHQSKEFAHKCMICLRSFATKGSLKLHTTTCKKSAEQKFSCASCGKVFSKKIHLNSHMRFSHPDIDVDPRFKYKCPNCPQRYMTEDELLVDHAKEGCITPGDVCDLCGEIYYIRGGLEAHMKAAHSQTVHSTRQGRPPKVGIEPSTPGNATDVDDCGEISSSLDIDVPSIVKIESMSPQSPD